MPPADPTNAKLNILHAAKELFAVRGYDGTSVREICQHAGVNVAMISYHFGGKESVFAALFEHFFPTDKIERLSKRLEDPVEGLKLFIVELTRYRYAEGQMLLILQQEITLQSSRIETIRHYVFPVWRKLIELLLRGREAGAFHFHSIDYTFLSVLGALLFHKKTDYFSPLAMESPVGFEDSCRYSVQFILNALGAGQHTELDEEMLRGYE